VVSIGIMNTQINLRLSEEFLSSLRKKAKLRGFSNIQEFIKDVLREKLFDEDQISKDELVLVKKLIKANEEKSLYGTEKELFKKLRYFHIGLREFMVIVCFYLESDLKMTKGRSELFILLISLL
jgi:Arc/MetJ-type ribon-helix-helix transcriptional regulator